MQHTTVIRRRPDLLRLLPGSPARTPRRARRGEDGATTAEYATVTGAAVGFGALLWKLITSDLGQKLIEMIFTWIMSLLPM